MKNSLCAGCLKARYCSLGCQRSDWAVHGDWCEMKRKAREEKRGMGMKERAMQDIEEDNNVD